MSAELVAVADEISAISAPAEPHDQTLFAVMRQIDEELAQLDASGGAIQQRTTAAEMLSALRSDYRDYCRRVETSVDTLRKRVLEHQELLAFERSVLAEENEKMRAALAERYLELSTRSAASPNVPREDEPPSARSLPPAFFSGAASAREGPSAQGSADEGVALIAYWKALHARLQGQLELVENELETTNQQVADAEVAASGELHKIHSLIATLREKEATERERGRQYAALLAQLQGPLAQSACTPAAAERRDDSKQRALSEIEESYVKAESAALDECLGCVGDEVELLRHVLSVFTEREEALREKIGAQARGPQPHQLSVNELLEAALELRTRLDSASGGTDGDLRQQHQLDFNQIAAAAGAAAEDLAQRVRDAERELQAQQRAMEAALRERQVQMIRAQHISGDDPDARFTRLRTEQCIDVVSRQIALAEQDKMRLMRAAEASTSAAQRNAFFLRRCT